MWKGIYVHCDEKTEGERRVKQNTCQVHTNKKPLEPKSTLSVLKTPAFNCDSKERLLKSQGVDLSLPHSTFLLWGNRALAFFWRTDSSFLIPDLQSGALPRPIGFRGEVLTKK